MNCYNPKDKSVNKRLGAFIISAAYLDNSKSAKYDNLARTAKGKDKIKSALMGYFNSPVVQQMVGSFAEQTESDFVSKSTLNKIAELEKEGDGKPAIIPVMMELDAPLARELISEMMGKHKADKEVFAEKINNAITSTEKIKIMKEEIANGNLLNENSILSGINSANDVTPDVYRMMGANRTKDFAADWNKHRKGFPKRSGDEDHRVKIKVQDGIEGTEDLVKMVNDSLLDLADVLGLPYESMFMFVENGRKPLTINIVRSKTTGTSVKERGAKYNPKTHSIDLLYGVVDGSFASAMADALNLGVINHSGDVNIKEWRDQIFNLMRYDINAKGQRRQSEIYEESMKMENGSEKRVPYWSDKNNMVNRAFEAYLLNKIKEQNRKNEFLARVQPKNSIYPNDAKLDQVVQTIDGMFEAMEVLQGIIKGAKTAPQAEAEVAEETERPVAPEEVNHARNTESALPVYKASAFKRAGGLEDVPHPIPLTSTTNLIGASDEALDGQFNQKLKKLLADKELIDILNEEYSYGPDGTSFKLSTPQKDFILRALVSFQGKMSDGERNGFMVSAGPGVGKTATALAIAAYFMKKGKDAFYIIPNQNVLSDSNFMNTRKMFGIGNKDVVSDTNSPLKFIGKALDDRKEGRIEDNPFFMVASYGSLGSGATLHEDLTNSLPEDYDGLIILDEFHLATQGKKKEDSARTKYIKTLQEKYPNAAFLYMSGTALKQSLSLMSALRLGDTIKEMFVRGDEDFKRLMRRASTNVLEAIANQITREGYFQFAAIDTTGLTARERKIDIKDEQLDYYNQSKEIWMDIVKYLNHEQKENVENSPNPKTKLVSVMLRYYTSLNSAITIESIAPEIQEDVANGYKPAVYIEDTYEAVRDRLEEYLALENRVDINPKLLYGRLNMLMVDWILNPENFPVYANKLPKEVLVGEGAEEGKDFFVAEKWYEVPHDPKTQTAVRLGTKGVASAKANGKVKLKSGQNVYVIKKADDDLIKQRNDIIQKIQNANLPMLPADKLREVLKDNNITFVEGTGRDKVFQKGEYVDIPEGTSATKKVDRFNSDDAKVMIMNQVLGTGYSMHNTGYKHIKGTRKLYIVDPGKEAAKAMQALYRFNRTGQVDMPVIESVRASRTSDRFTASIVEAAKEILALSTGAYNSSGMDLFNDERGWLLDDYARNEGMRSWLSVNPEVRSFLSRFIKTEKMEMRQLLNLMPLLTEPNNKRKAEEMAEDLRQHIYNRRQDAKRHGLIASNDDIKVGVNGIESIEYINEAMIAKDMKVQVFKVAQRSRGPIFIGEAANASELDVVAKQGMEKPIGKLGAFAWMQKSERYGRVDSDKLPVSQDFREGFASLIGMTKDGRVSGDVSGIEPMLDTPPNWEGKAGKRSETIDPKDYWSAMFTEMLALGNTANESKLPPEVYRGKHDRIIDTFPHWRVYFDNDAGEPEVGIAYFDVRQGGRPPKPKKDTWQNKIRNIKENDKVVLKIIHPDGSETIKPLFDPKNKDAQSRKLYLKNVADYINRLSDPKQNRAIVEDDIFKQAWEQQAKSPKTNEIFLYALRGNLLPNIVNIVESVGDNFVKVTFFNKEVRGDEEFFGANLRATFRTGEQEKAVQSVIAAVNRTFDDSGNLLKAPEMPTPTEDWHKFTLKSNFILNKEGDVQILKEYDEEGAIWLAVGIGAKRGFKVPSGFTKSNRLINNKMGVFETRDFSAVQKLAEVPGWVDIENDAGFKPAIGPRTKKSGKEEEVIDAQLKAIAGISDADYQAASDEINNGEEFKGEIWNEEDDNMADDGIWNFRVLATGQIVVGSGHDGGGKPITKRHRFYQKILDEIGMMAGDEVDSGQDEGSAERALKRVDKFYNK